jgi:hypothetical protein
MLSATELRALQLVLEYEGSHGALQKSEIIAVLNAAAGDEVPSELHRSLALRGVIRGKRSTRDRHSPVVWCVTNVGKNILKRFAH